MEISKFPKQKSQCDSLISLGIGKKLEITVFPSFSKLATLPNIYLWRITSEWALKESPAGQFKHFLKEIYNKKINHLSGIRESQQQRLHFFNVDEVIFLNWAKWNYSWGLKGKVNVSSNIGLQDHLQCLEQSFPKVIGSFLISPRTTTKKSL